MNIIKGDNGFPYSWKAGRVEQLVRNIIEEKARNQLPVDSVMLINPIWLGNRDLAEEIGDANPDFIICCNFVDPIVVQVEDAIRASGIPAIFIGNHSNYRIDFWAMVCDLNFRSYTTEELSLNPAPRKFICLNRKPHAHRRILVDQLQTVADQGYISLGYDNNAIMVDHVFTEDQGIADAMPDRNPIGNDVYSLGNISVWQDSYLNIVTETTFGTANADNFFISEKTWKPIIGHRPFFIYGQPRLRNYLQAQGFDIFADIIDYARLAESADEFEYAQLAIDTVNKINNVGQTYHRLQARLDRNQQRFRSYVYEQWNKLLSLDLKEYL